MEEGSFVLFSKIYLRTDMYMNKINVYSTNLRYYTIKTKMKVIKFI